MSYFQCHLSTIISINQNSILILDNFNIYIYTYLKFMIKIIIPDVFCSKQGRGVLFLLLVTHTLNKQSEGQEFLVTKLIFIINERIIYEIKYLLAYLQQHCFIKTRIITWCICSILTKLLLFITKKERKKERREIYYNIIPNHSFPFQYF